MRCDAVGIGICSPVGLPIEIRIHGCCGYVITRRDAMPRVSESPILSLFRYHFNFIPPLIVSLFGIAQKVTKKASPSDKKLENLQPSSV